MDTRQKSALAAVFFVGGILLAIFLRQIGISGISFSLPLDFLWIWALPILAIPVLYFFFINDADDQGRRERDLAGLSGVKGGSASRDGLFGDEDDEE